MFSGELAIVGLLIALVPLGLLVLIVFGVYVWRGDRHPRSIFGAYLFLVTFIGVAGALVGARMLTQAVANAVVDEASTYDCSEPFRQLQGSAEEDAGPISVPPIATSTVGQPTVPTAPLPAPAKPIQVGECSDLSTGDNAGGLAAAGGTIVIVAAGVIWFHARAGRRLLNEEASDG